MNRPLPHHLLASRTDGWPSRIRAEPGPGRWHTTPPTTKARAPTGVFANACRGNEGLVSAPQSGHVSNFRRPVSPLIEPMVAHCFESDPCELLARVRDSHPVWTRLEPAKGAQVDSG